MKGFLFASLFLLGSFGLASAQNPNASQGASPAMQQTPPANFPQWLVVRILQAAQPNLYPYTGMHLGQLIQGYRSGAVVITYICRDEDDVCKGVYRVSAGGGETTQILIDSL